MQQCQRSSWYILQRNFHLWRPPQSKGTLLCVSRCVHVRLPGPLGPAPVIIFGANPCGPTVGHGIKIWNGVRCQWMLMPRNLSSWCWSTHLPTPFLSCSIRPLSSSATPFSPLCWREPKGAQIWPPGTCALQLVAFCNSQNMSRAAGILLPAML